MKYLGGGSTRATEQGVSNLISSGVDDDYTEGRVSNPMNLEISVFCSERAIRSGDLKRCCSKRESNPISSGDGVEKNPLLCNEIL
nr:hypothetical protein CFP56_29825 [Quercus suber]